MVVFVAGHNGMVGSSVLRILNERGVPVVVANRSELDLRDEPSVLQFLLKEKVTAVIDAAAVVGGIQANDSFPYNFLIDNIRIQSSLINCAVNAKIKKFIFLGSSCIYPKLALQPIKEEYLLTGPLESTNQWYAIAKIAGVKMCESVNRQFGYNYVSLMPTNLYGPGDNFDLESSHVIPAMIRKIHNAKKNGRAVILWGTGSPYREFLHVNDLSNAICTVLLSTPTEGLLNVGSGVDITIKELAQLISQVIGYTGDIKWDGSKPDGTPRKVLNIEKISSLGWEPSINLKDGLTSTYQWFLENESNLRTLNFSN